MMKTDLLTTEEKIKGKTPTETRELLQMLSDATDYIQSFSWCPPVKKKYMGLGIAGVLGVFLFQFEEAIMGKDEFLWIVTGDLPSAYVVTDQAKDPLTALQVYCKLMHDWAAAVLQQKNLDDQYPVQSPVDHEHANMLLSRVQFIREKIIPFYSTVS